MGKGERVGKRDDEPDPVEKVFSTAEVSRAILVNTVLEVYED